jgi:protein ImuA
VAAQRRVDIIASLQAEIHRLEGFKSTASNALDLGLGPILSAFPNNSFPLGAIHEFVSAKQEDSAAATGFLSGLLSSLMGTHGTTLWISTSRTLFPPALKGFGIDPDRFIFIDLNKESDVIWAMDEALKCAALTAVVGELHEITFTASRRLQLAVEQSQVTGFILRKSYGHKSKALSTTACVSRWSITSLPGEIIEDLPGVGFPKWRVELSRMRNGKPGNWDVAWMNGKFEHLQLLQTFQTIRSASEEREERRKAG